MILCAECYIQRNGQTLMLYRDKKADDINQGKWVGVGGKFEAGESPEQCLVREVQEETGLTLREFRLRGLMTFVVEGVVGAASAEAGSAVEGESAAAGELAPVGEAASDPMLIFVYTATAFEGELTPCNEGTLQWIDTDRVCDLNLWEGDKLFWEWMQQSDKLFSAHFTYSGETLTRHEVTFY